MTPRVPNDLATQSSRAKLLVPVTSCWFNIVPTLPPLLPNISHSSAQLSTLLDRASSLHFSELSAFSALPNAAGGSASDRGFLQNILAGGTLSDRLSALTLMVQGAPLHNVRALEALKSSTERGRGGFGVSQETEKGKGKGTGREDRLKAARAIMDWWVGGGAPNRKLRYFRDQPLLHPDVTDQHLIVWYFEDWLKKYFFSYLQILEAFSMDPLPYVRMQSLALIATLLRSNPEQEQNLLRLLVNKLGDTENAICARTSHYLLHVLQEHPAMKAVIIHEATTMIMRPSLPPSLTAASRSQPNINTRLSSGGPKSARNQEQNGWRAHARYYATITFNQIVLSTSEADRTSARTLMDVYFHLFRETISQREPDGLVTIVKGLNDNQSKKIQRKADVLGNSKEVRGSAGFAEIQDSNAKLLGAILTGVNRALPYARLGVEHVEFDNHMDTLFLLVHTSTFNISLRALTLIQQIVASLSASSPIVARFYRALYLSLFDIRLYTTRNQALFLNLLFKSLKADSHQARMVAFVKRFCQVLVSGFGGSEFVAGGLWLLGELFSASPGLRTLIDEAPLGVGREEYDPYKREPQYAHAQSSAIWELTTLVHHAHPTVALLARQLLSHEPLTTSPDLTLYTLTHFLDRFVYKNPKKTVIRGTSAMQPSAFGGVSGVRRVRGDMQETPLNVDEWWRRESGVAADQVFFQRYFSQKHGKAQARVAKIDKRKGKHTKSDGGATEESSSGDGNNDSDSEEAIIWNAMEASLPKAEADGDDEDDDNDDDDDCVEHSIRSSEPGEHPSSRTEGDQAGQSGPEHGSNVDWEFSDVGDDSDADDLDAEIPVHVTSPRESWVSNKRKRQGPEKDDVRMSKRKLRALPTFASYDDYAQMIEDGPEENL
ncbi:CBF-domain-containing protein [Russula earlei]|uniref:CBF-domain-containing protein n=1 Tax=Russula earlei TaxID=71964 RepID=A0ACC0TY10_9AGAM|nr:CBF-domain-containing protein [Russula earlei]